LKKIEIISKSQSTAVQLHSLRSNQPQNEILCKSMSQESFSGAARTTENDSSVFN